MRKIIPVLVGVALVLGVTTLGAAAQGPCPGGVCTTDIPVIEGNVGLNYNAALSGLGPGAFSTMPARSSYQVTGPGIYPYTSSIQWTTPGGGRGYGDCCNVFIGGGGGGGGYYSQPFFERYWEDFQE